MTNITLIPAALDKFIETAETFHDFAAGLDNLCNQYCAEISNMQIKLPDRPRTQSIDDAGGHALETALFNFITADPSPVNSGQQKGKKHPAGRLTYWRDVFQIMQQCVCLASLDRRIIGSCSLGCQTPAARNAAGLSFEIRYLFQDERGHGNQNP